MMTLTARPKKAHTTALVALGAILLNGVAHSAELPVSPQTLGAADATIEFCATADEPRADQYRANAGLFFNGASEDQLAEVRKTREYRTAYDDATAALRQMGKDEALGTCKKLLQRTP